MQEFNNKVIWITGASSGIGKAIAIEFAKKNAVLILSSRNVQELEFLKNNIASFSKNTVHIVAIDMQDQQSILNAYNQVKSIVGRVDFLINNAGISQRSLVTETPIDIDRKLMEVNYFGQVALTKLVLQLMQQQQSGHITVISSLVGKIGFYYRSAYAASKHALHGFYESLRMEVYKQNINILMVCPGKIKTNISINAIKQDGSTHGVMDESQDKGMSAEKCAEQIINAISNNKSEINIGGKELLALWVKRFFPSLFLKIIRKQKPE